MMWRDVRGWGVAAVLMALGAVAGASGVGAAEPAAPGGALVVASGEINGTAYLEAGAVCRLADRAAAGPGAGCLVQPTAGSAVDVALLHSGAAQLAVVQSRTLAEAFSGQGPFAATGAMPELRALFSLHGEPVAVLLAANSKIKRPADLKGKRLNLGKPGSYQRSMADALLAAEGIRMEDLTSSLEMEPPRMVKALCDGQIDAAVITGLSPLADVQTALDDCDASLLPLRDAAITAFLNSHPAYVPLTLHADDYQGLDADVPSFGLRAVLATTTRLPDAEAYRIVKAVMGDTAALRSLHPLLRRLDRKDMAGQGLAVPPHDGALRYYKEKGLP